MCLNEVLQGKGNRCFLSEKKRKMDVAKAGKQRERTIKAKWRDRTTKPKQHDPALRAKQRDNAIKAKQLLLSVIQPPSSILVVAPFAIAAMMIWVFLFDNQTHPVAYAFYALSFYLLVVICAGVFSKKNVQRVKELACKIRVMRRILNEDDYRLRVSIVLCIALVSLFTLEMAMLTTFGTGDTVLPFVMPIITGSVVAVILCWMGIVTVKRAK